MIRKSRNLLIDIQPSCYDVRLTKGWAKKVLKVSRNYLGLDEITFDFVAELRAVAHTSRLPLEMLNGMQAFHNGYVRESKMEVPVEKVANAMVSNLAKGDPSLTPAQLTKLRGICLETRFRLNDINDASDLKFPRERAWADLLSTRQFQMTLWGMQRTCYVAIYNAYESFATSCVCVAKRQPTFRRRSLEKFAPVVKELFGEVTYALCFEDSKLKQAQLIRHSLSHAGGRRMRWPRLDGRLFP